MSELVLKAAWGVLALIHAPPALVFFNPALLARLYGVAPSAETGLLLVHRGALFAAVAAACALAVLDPSARRAAGLVAAISMISFIWLYVSAGTPAGSLRTIFIVDVIALAPLALVLAAAWRPQLA